MQIAVVSRLGLRSASGRIAGPCRCAGDSRRPRPPRGAPRAAPFPSQQSTPGDERRIPDSGCLVQGRIDRVKSHPLTSGRRGRWRANSTVWCCRSFQSVHFNALSDPSRVYDATVSGLVDTRPIDWCWQPEDRHRHAGGEPLPHRHRPRAHHRISHDDSRSPFNGSARRVALQPARRARFSHDGVVHRSVRQERQGNTVPGQHSPGRPRHDARPPAAALQDGKREISSSPPWVYAPHQKPRASPPPITYGHFAIRAYNGALGFSYLPKPAFGGGRKVTWA